MKRILGRAMLVGLLAVFYMACAESGDGIPEAHEYLVYVANGGSNPITAYAIITDTGELKQIAGSPFKVAPGSGHITIDPKGQFGYVTFGSSDPSKLNASYASAFSINPTTGALEEIPGSTVTTVDNAGPVAIDPTGRFAYVPAGGSRLVSGFSIDAATGLLTEMVGSPFAVRSTPYSIAIDPSGRIMYLPNVDSISAYSIDAGTGALTETAESPFNAGGAPVSIAIDPKGKFAYAANHASDTISAYSIDATTGALTEIAGSPVTAGGFPSLIRIDPLGKFAYLICLYPPELIRGFTINTDTGALKEMTGSPFAQGENNYLDIAIDPTGRFVYVGLVPGKIRAYKIDVTTGALTEIAGSPFATIGSAGSIVAVRLKQTI